MALAKRFTSLSITGVSVLGGAAHNLGQLFVAAAVVRTGSLMYYFPALLVAGTIAGTLIGLLGGLVTVRLGPFLRQGV